MIFLWEFIKDRTAAIGGFHENSLRIPQVFYDHTVGLGEEFCEKEEQVMGEFWEQPPESVAGPPGMLRK